MPILDRRAVTKMIRYELKKIFGKISAKIALAVLIVTLIVSCSMAVGNAEWVNEQGEKEYGYAAAQKLRTAQKAWAGPLDEEKLRQVILENQRIENSPEAQSESIRERDIAFGWKQGFYEIWWLMNYSYADGFRSLDTYTADSVTPDMVGSFYDNRVTLLEKWLYDETDVADSLYSEPEKQFLLKRYRDLETPLYYDYVGGWDGLQYGIGLLISIFALVITFLAAGIFSDEFRWKSDAVFFSTRHGRQKGIRSKVAAGFLMATALYWAGVIPYCLFTLCYLGFDGWNCPVQIMYWKSFYHISVLQLSLMTVVFGYIGTLFLTFLTMWVSGKTKSAVFSVIVPFIIIFLPSILENIGNSTVNQIIGLLPDRLLIGDSVVTAFSLYSVGKSVFGAAQILPWLYLILTVLLVPAMYRGFSKKQIL